jgi:hypothetical protein
MIGHLEWEAQDRGRTPGAGSSFYTLLTCTCPNFTQDATTDTLPAAKCRWWQN